jgi:CIC family chloride channel protein
MSLSKNKHRLVIISLTAVVIAIAVSLIARSLVYLIDWVTNLAFYHRFSFDAANPAGNTLGPWVVLVPVIGGLVVGLMALFGSPAIRGHGIPEAMEQILTNQSKIKPAITYLKPLSSAIAIGTGGPFGAEGPIIATGGALGSTLGQLIRISPNERKILLAAGATAGMSAIFGSPLAAIFLAIELLLFEFSPRSILPVALACVTGAAGHHFLFGEQPVFLIRHTISQPSNLALLLYSVMGLCIGVISVGITKSVYAIEDLFDKLPIHWAWGPAVGGLAVGVIGYFAPHTLGVGYSNITDVLSGSFPVQVIFNLCVLKFLSWAIALGSGTSGGTLAPLLTIGGATGALLGITANQFFPQANISLPLAALVGMSAMFAGASRALLTSIVFALETTGQPNALLPLLASCIGAYFVSYLLMENTIMTEKIARRGVRTPHSYEPDMLEKLTVGEIMRSVGPLQATPFADSVLVGVDESVRSAVSKMIRARVDLLSVVSDDHNTIIGLVGHKEVLSAYEPVIDDNRKTHPHISLKRRSLKLLVRSQRVMASRKK